MYEGVVGKVINGFIILLKKYKCLLKHFFFKIKLNNAPLIAFYFLSGSTKFSQNFLQNNHIKSFKAI